ncbi:Gar1/Naf1 RNA binding region-domain-containing protein [Mortierella sp. GBAus27b]|nr:Gar1/Naf1 RNA binding region-domain-containing protein [Mortierella sp. GBAus27b]
MDVETGNIAQGGSRSCHSAPSDSTATQPQLQLDQPSSIPSATSSMEVDNPTSASEASIETIPKENPQLYNRHHSFTHTQRNQSKIRAHPAGNDPNAAGYESSDLESSDDDEGPESSDSDSDSDSDSGTPRGKRDKALTIEQREKALIEIDAMDEDTDITSNGILHTVNEIVQLPEVKKPDIVLGPDSRLEPIGAVTTVVDNVVVVQASSSGEVRVLDTGTIVAIQKVKEEDSEGDKEIFETFGPVTRPFYSIRFNTAAEIPTACVVGCTIYSVPEHSSFEPLKSLKGSDASNKFDEEVDEVEMGEMEHKRMLKQSKNTKGTRERKVPMAADTSAAMQAMMGQTPTSSTAALPPKPTFDESLDGYRDTSAAWPPTAAGTVPWYQQQQRDLQNMMGTKPQVLRSRSNNSRTRRCRKPSSNSNKIKSFQQQLQMQQQQQQQLKLYIQQQIEEAQATILRLKRQQEQLQLQNQQAMQLQQQTQLPQHPQFSPQTGQSLDVHYSQFSTQGTTEGGQQQIANLLSPLFPQSQKPQQPQ